MKCVPTSAERRGFVLLESLLALSIFGMIATGFTIAIFQVGKAAAGTGERMRIQRQVETLLTEASKAVEFEPGDEALGEDEKGVYYSRIIEEMEVINMDGQPLQSMFRVAIVAEWTDQSGRELSRIAEQIRYEPLYQNTQ